MKKLSMWALTISFCGLLVAGCATMNAGPASSDPATAPADAAAAAKSPALANVGYVEKIAFDKTADKERVIVSASKLMGYTASRDSARTLVITLDKMYVPDDLKTKIPEGSFKVIEGVYSSQTKSGERPVTAVKIVLKDAVPHLVREEGNQLIVDVDIANMPQSPSMTKDVDRIRATQPEPKAREIKVEKKEGKEYKGQKITADFQDANIRSVFRLIAEVSGLNIVAGEDVKGLVTMKLTEVPWDQALETIMDIQQLGTKVQGNVIVVMPADKLKKAEEQRLKEDVSRGKLKQISIEAQIVEAVDTFLRRLGVQWGGGLLTNAGNTTIGALAGSAGYASGLTQGSTGATTIPQAFPNGVGFTGSNQAVNFPFSWAGTPGLGSPDRRGQLRSQRPDQCAGELGRGQDHLLPEGHNARQRQGGDQAGRGSPLRDRIHLGRRRHPDRDVQGSGAQARREADHHPRGKDLHGDQGHQRLSRLYTVDPGQPAHHQKRGRLHRRGP